MYLLSECVKCGVIDISKARYISAAKHAALRNSALEAGDVLVVKTGDVGKSAVVPDSLTGANISVHVAKIRLKDGYNPYFVSAFVNCSYGYAQLMKRSLKTTRPEIKLVELQDIQIPKMSDEFDALIEEVTRRGIDTRAESVRLYTQAQDLLTSQLGQVPQSSRNTTTRSLSEVFSAGRLDAEYFMPKYDGLLDTINSYKDGCAPISSLFRQVTTKCSRTELSYRYVEISDTNVGTSSATCNIIMMADLPDNAKIMTRNGDVLVSKVRANRFKAVLKKCGIQDTNFHTLRHTFATRCVEIGFDVKTLSEILGHASVNMTLKRYVHPSMKTKRENAVKKLVKTWEKWLVQWIS